MLEKEILKFKENNNYEENYKNKTLFEELINNFDLEFRYSKWVFDSSKVESHTAIIITNKMPKIFG